MTYEMMNWDAEANRVTRAFEIDEKCIWDKRGSPESAYLCPLRATGEYISIAGGKIVSVCYSNFGDGDDQKFFSVRTPECVTRIVFWWDGAVKLSPVDYTHSLTLAKAFFYLDLLTLEAEQALRLTISDHQKMEWKLDYANH